MILGAVVLTTGLAVAIIALTVAALVAIAWRLRWFDRDRHVEPRFDEPDWWPEFERQLEDYLSSRD